MSKVLAQWRAQLALSMLVAVLGADAMALPPHTGITCEGAATVATAVEGDSSLTGCKDPEGRWHGPRLKRGVGRRLSERVEYVHGKRHGFAWAYAADGSLESLGQFEDDLPTGLWSYYSGPQRKVLEGEFLRGRMHGVWVQWDSKGRVLGMTSFRNGSGHFVRWAANGERAEEGIYVDGVKKGVWRTYRPDMSLVTERTHVDDLNYLERDFSEANLPVAVRCIISGKIAWEGTPDVQSGKTCP